MTILHNDTVTIFNKISTGRGQATWKATIIEGCHVENSQGAVLNKYGSDTDNKVEVYLPSDDFRKQKAWLHEQECFTAQTGIDLILIGSWTGESEINDADYPKGFDDYLLKSFDDVYRINNVSLFKLIPHLELGCG